LTVSQSRGSDDKETTTHQAEAKNAYDPRKDCLYRWYMRATIFGACGAILGVIVLICQTVLLKRSTDASKDAASAAKTSADSLKNIERPWVLLNVIDRWAVRGEDGNQRIAVKWRLKNFGKTPALVEKIEGNIDVIPLTHQFSEEPVYVKPWSTIYDHPIIPPGEQSFDVVFAMNRDWEEFELSAVTKGALRLIASGHIVYRDPFGDLHETHFCLRSDRASDPSVPDGPRKYNTCT